MGKKKKKKYLLIIPSHITASKMKVGKISKKKKRRLAFLKIQVTTGKELTLKLAFWVCSGQMCDFGPFLPLSALWAPSLLPSCSSKNLEKLLSWPARRGCPKRMLIPSTFPKIIAYGRSISFGPYREQKHFVHFLLLCCLPNLPDDWLFILLCSHRLVSTSYMVRPGRMLIIPHCLYKKYFSRVSCISYSLGHFDWDSPASPARRGILSLSCSLTLILPYSLFHLSKNKTNKQNLT